MLEAALSAGLCSSGVDVVLLGVVPTPTVAFAARVGDFDLGAVISASHNPAPDNGIKFVTHEGKKTSDEVEEIFESLMSDGGGTRPTGADVGVITESRTPVEAYVEMLKAIVPLRLDGLKVALDAANGAAYELGPQILHALGAKVSLMGVSPDGMNINTDGGATKPRSIQDFTVEAGADIGVAFDGDADRAVFSDRVGGLINGDRTIGLWAAHQRSLGLLDPPIVVGTVMSNGGFEAYLTRLGIQLDRAPVGDKYVSQRIEATGARIGGEQSGHIVFPERGPTGDGIVTMLEVLKALVERGGDSTAFSLAYEPWPQLLVNVGVSSAAGWREAPNVSAQIEAGEARLSGHGRILVRPSGTQPMIRVMVEADDAELRDAVADRVVEAMARDLDGRVHGRVDLTYALGD
jgi:phosphoglucosamine mutase